MEVININASTNYDVIVEKGIIKDCGKYISQVHKPCKACVITDDNVSKYYLNITSASLSENGFDVCRYIFKNGEEHKNLQTVSDILEFLASEHLTRSDLIIALGGGIVGDVAGFAASSYLRGISFVQIPTTFLAAIDSSVGGKTGVNLSSGKNLCGAFYQPIRVICDYDTFNTMDKNRYLDGTAEAIKYAVLNDKNILELINSDILSTIVKCVKIKRDYVLNDEFDKGNRQFLNLGHTIGHAVEKLSDYKISHGYAVAIGMVLISELGEKLGITENGTAEKLKNVIESFGLPTSCEFSKESIFEVTLNDKKRKGNTITLVIPKNIGECVLKEITIDDYKELLKD